MKKILLILLMIPFFVFANDKQSLSNQEIKQKIIGKWNMYQIGQRAQIVTFYDDGKVSYKTYICNDNSQKALYDGEFFKQYKVEDGIIYLGELLVEDGYIEKLKVENIEDTRLKLVYDMPDYFYNKLEINFLNTTGKDTLPFCEFNTVNPFSHKVDRKKFQDNLHTLQDKIIEGFKKQTPKDLDVYTVLQDVYKNNNELFFKLTIKNFSIKDANDETLKAFLSVFAVDKYCDIDKSDNKILQRLKNIFPNGASYVYSFDNGEPLVIHVDNSSCQKQ